MTIYYACPTTEMDSAIALWDYYTVTCRSFLETDQPDVGKTVFGDNGIHLQTLNGLLAVRLASVVTSHTTTTSVASLLTHPSAPVLNNAQQSEVFDQLMNYEAICARLQKNHEDQVLKEALTMKQLYDMCTIVSGGAEQECKTLYG